MKGIGGVLLTPLDGTEFPITSPGPNGGYESTDPILFGAAGVTSGQTVKWKTTLSYQASGGVPSPAASAVLSFNTVGSGQISQSYVSEGGQLSVAATVGTFTDKVTDVITGVVGGIPDCTIAAELNSLYTSGATPGLLRQIAQKESSYRQFALESLYNVGSLWPYENQITPPVMGSYIGLMQDKLVANGFNTPMATAWDWILNATTGYDILESKIPIVGKLQTYAQSTHTGLPALTSLQIENMSLGLYSGNAKYNSQLPLISLQSQYYFPRMYGDG